MTFIKIKIFRNLLCNSIHFSQIMIIKLSFSVIFYQKTNKTLQN